MSATLQTQVSFDATGACVASPAIAKRLASVRAFLAETSTHELIEAATLLMVATAAAGLMIGAFGVHIGAH